jgi:formylglycine-generating enzyme required for sulfatase activity
VQHRVTLTKGFWLGVYPVTQAQWLAVMGTCPADVRGETFPVLGALWDDCMVFCERLGEKVRLPTEAEWERACRAGTTTAYHTGDGLAGMRRAGWCNHDGTWGTGRKSLPGYLDYGKGAGPKPVGHFEPNAWGLYDMHGNAWEWCADWYASERPGNEVDPCGPAIGTKRVLRGGCYFNDAKECRSAYRACLEPDSPGIPAAGLRVCLGGA